MTNNRTPEQQEETRLQNFITEQKPIVDIDPISSTALKSPFLNKKHLEFKRELGRMQRQVYKGQYRLNHDMKEANKIIKEHENLVKKRLRANVLKTTESKREYERLYYERTKAKKIAKVKAYQEKKKGILSTLKYPPLKKEINHDPESEDDIPNKDLMINEPKKITTQGPYRPAPEPEPEPKLEEDQDKINKINEIYNMQLNQAINLEDPDYKTLAEKLKELALRTYDNDYIRYYNEGGDMEYNPDFEYHFLSDSDFKVLDRKDFKDYMLGYIGQDVTDQDVTVAQLPIFIREHKKVLRSQSE